MSETAPRLPQQAMIGRARAACQADQRVVAALMYGSFTRGEGDAYSDVEFALFVEDKALPQLDQRAWVAQLAPVLAYFSDAHGHFTVHFVGLIRGEFHFKPASAIAWVATWRENTWFPSLEAALLVDRTGELSHVLASLVGPAPERDTPEEVQRLGLWLIDGISFGTAVLARGERARALELHGPEAWVGRPGHPDPGWLQILATLLMTAVAGSWLWRRRRTNRPT
jgi:lincosamide nucleotidyltransferase